MARAAVLVGRGVLCGELRCVIFLCLRRGEKVKLYTTARTRGYDLLLTTKKLRAISDAREKEHVAVFAACAEFLRGAEDLLELFFIDDFDGVVVE